MLGVVRGRRLALVEAREEAVQLGRRASGEDELPSDAAIGSSGPSETAFRGHRCTFPETRRRLSPV